MIEDTIKWKMMENGEYHPAFDFNIEILADMVRAAQVDDMDADSFEMLMNDIITYCNELKINLGGGEIN